GKLGRDLRVIRGNISIASMSGLNGFDLCLYCFRDGLCRNRCQNISLQQLKLIIREGCMGNRLIFFPWRSSDVPLISPLLDFLLYLHFVLALLVLSLFFCLPSL